MNENSRIYSTLPEGFMRHFITIKPNPNHYKDNTNKFEELLRYYKKHNISYWLREVKSPAGYLHIHGIISYPEADDFSKRLKQSKTIHKWFNRNVGFYTDVVMSGKVDDVINYIKGSSNILQREAFSNSLTLIEPLKGVKLSEPM